jgi:hypothetical protein
MAPFIHPALRAFVESFATEILFVQVLVRRTAVGWELRHVADRKADAAKLRPVPAAELRGLAQFTASGAFRPLKCAPSLVGGWRCAVASEAELGDALERLYPGAVADWFAAQQPNVPVTHYREFTGRQTGMYRGTAALDDATAAAVTRAGCAAEFCGRRRLWTVPGLEADAADAKSLVPCLEPCAVMLEFARKTRRIEQEDKLPLALGPSELDSLVIAVERALAAPDPKLREGDLAAPGNPRRLRRLLEKLASVPRPTEAESDH